MFVNIRGSENKYETWMCEMNKDAIFKKMFQALPPSFIACPHNQLFFHQSMMWHKRLGRKADILVSCFIVTVGKVILIECME